MLNGGKTRGVLQKIAGLCLLLSLVGAGCTQGPSAATVAASKPVTINVWGVNEDESLYEPIFTDFHKLHPYVTIQYRSFNLDEYESQILNALAEDRGPDVFLINNSWVGKYLPKIQPMPASTQVAEQFVVGTLQKKVQYQLVAEPTVTLRDFKNNEPDVVSSDMLRTVNVSPTTDKTDYEQRVMGIPLSVDTLGMYVNKDLLNAAGITTIPQTWDVFQTDVQKLVKQDDQGNILQAGAAIGTAYNVERAPDLISVLMMQNGADMSAADGTPTFTTIPLALANVRDEPPAYQAMSFYTDFADPSKAVYTWNDKQPDSLEAFVEGKAAFFFGYAYDLPVITTRAPKLNLEIASLPQIQGNPEANFANYWAWVVSKRTANSDVAWNLVNFMSTPDESAKYLAIAKLPAALKSQLGAQLNDEQIGVFAAQVLTAKSWYRGNDPKAADDAFNTMIETVVAGGSTAIPDAVHAASDKISQTIIYGTTQ
ncbi:MAG: extracellular solute-binding protein [Patescibacteria group bacterium]